jgi:hypothetical protein
LAIAAAASVIEGAPLVLGARKPADLRLEKLRAGRWARSADMLEAGVVLLKRSCDGVAVMKRAAERCCVLLWRESCADGLTCDRHGAPMTTLRKLQITMMMTDVARDDAVAYLDVLRAYDDDDAAVLLTCVKESVISAKHTYTLTRLTRDNLLHAGTHLHPGSSAPSEGQPRYQA